MQHSSLKGLVPEKEEHQELKGVKPHGVWSLIVTRIFTSLHMSDPLVQSNVQGEDSSSYRSLSVGSFKLKA